MALILAYTLLMLAAYSFPDEAISGRVASAVDILADEGNMLGGYARYFGFSAFGITDNLTDKAIYLGLLRNGRSIADAAMRTDYSRYWHGYAVLLRPLMAVLSIVHIRYINMLFVTVMLTLCYYRCRVLLGGRTALCFIVGLLMSFIAIAPFCQQYMSVTALTLLGCYAVLRLNGIAEERMNELFFLLGSLVCFFDFLTFPVLALGYPLVCLLLALNRRGESASALWRRALLPSALWVAGYALTWLGKALIGSLLTDVNVLEDILSQVGVRTTGEFNTGDSVIAISAAESVKINLETFFMGANKACFAALLLWTAARALLSRAPASDWRRALPVAVVALWPFIWYCVLQNHTRVHFWMTHKQLSVTVFALCSALLSVGGAKNTEKSKNDVPDTVALLRKS